MKDFGITTIVSIMDEKKIQTNQDFDHIKIDIKSSNLKILDVD